MSSVTEPTPQVTVVGSVNRDVVVRVPQLPRPGETLAARGTSERIGGKGANQAVAAARLGARTCWVGAVGHDGADVLAALEAHGIDVGSAVRVEDVRTGTALVFVEDSGENMVVIDAGANGRIRPEDLPRRITGALLLQHEVPATVIDRALLAADGLTILNPAPWRPVAAETLSRVDVLVVNATELAELTGRPVPRDAAAAADAVAALDAVPTVVTTLGAGGAVIRHHGDTRHLAAPSVPSHDTVGAGDTFCGALAVALVEGADMVEAARFAVHAASIAVSRPGGQEAMPTAEEVHAFLQAGTAPAVP
ncbi:ribokinase [Georgenia halophila]|uniref:Ribokinase n=1 Tax=Georgenia halophila TaxID=620889 RepID=A0ABP8LNZ7_9MICO